MTLQAPGQDHALKVLVADDDPDILRLVSTCLALEGWEVIQARDGREALELIHEHNPHLAILDLVMPHLYGYTLVRQIRQEPDIKHIPVILLTAQVNDEDLERGFEVGANDYIKKPFGTKELIARVKAQLRVE